MAKAALFVTCLVDLFEPQTGHAAVEVLARHGCQVEVPGNQTCCGQFAYNAGHLQEARAMAQHFVEVFESSDADALIGLSGSCTAMVIHEYPDLLRRAGLSRGDSAEESESWALRAQAVGERLVEFSEWLHHEESLPLPAVKPETVAVHHGCHMRRILGSTEETDDVLRSYGAQLAEYPDAEQCCGFGGTYSMTEPVVSTKLADAKRTALSEAKAAGASCLVSGDWGCLLHLSGRMQHEGDSWPVLHVAEWINQREKMSAKKGE